MNPAPEPVEASAAPTYRVARACSSPYPGTRVRRPGSAPPDSGHLFVIGLVLRPERLPASRTNRAHRHPFRALLARYVTRCSRAVEERSSLSTISYRVITSG